MDPERIRERLTGSAVDATRPDDSLAFQAMCLASDYDAAELDRIETACRARGEEWERAKREYAEFVTELAARWQAC
jgi:tryptophanyl-tRNA synthetase